MKNTALILSASRLSKIANSFGNHGIENFSELCEALDSRLSIEQFTPEQLAGIIDFADSQRQTGFYEGAKARQLHPNNSLVGYDSTTDTCDHPDYDEESDEGDFEDEEEDFSDDEDQDDEESFCIYLEKNGEGVDCPDNTWGDLESAKAHAREVAENIGGEVDYFINKEDRFGNCEEVVSGTFGEEEGGYIAVVLDSDRNQKAVNGAFYSAEEALDNACDMARHALNEDQSLKMLVAEVKTNLGAESVATALVVRNPLNANDYIVTKI